MKTKLSVTMIAAIKMAKDNNGRLVRHQGGFWGKPILGSEWHGTSTIEAIVARRYAEYVAWMHRGGNNGEFPVEMKLTDKCY